MPHRCRYCSKICRTARGLSQHIERTKDCREQHLCELTARRLAQDDSNQEASGARERSLGATPPRRSKRLKGIEESGHETESPHSLIARLSNADEDASFPDLDEDDGNTMRKDDYSDFDESKESNDGSYDFTANEDVDEVSEDSDKPPPNTEMLEQFRAYCVGHVHKYVRLTSQTVSSIKLMDALRRKKAPLNAYQEIMEWHLKETGYLGADHLTLKDTDKYFSRNTLMKQFTARYNMEAMYPKEKKVRLPFAKSVVSIPIRDAKDCIVSLLTDPHLRDTDYLFFDDNPLAPPPKKVIYLEDLNTGDAYRKSYDAMIMKQGQVLLPILYYIDGAVTGQFSALPVTAVKISLGIFKRETRDKAWAWRELGFIPQVRKERSRGKKIFKESQHLEAQDIVVMDGEGDTGDEDEDSHSDEDEDGSVKAQDFHTMLRAILKSFVELQRTGFVWDLVYNGKLYRNIHFVIFVTFVKCDTEEADLLCGKYLTRNKNVKHVCRYCHCPMDEADDPRAKYPMKTQAQIQKLCEKGDKERLQAISQQHIRNAWYEVTFHAANGRGIHGACPSEMLHAILLGIFGYLREIFFENMGKTSAIADDINGLAKMYGNLLIHQSDRDLPNTNFSRGIRKGKLMAKEYRGVLLVMAAVLKSTLGRSILMRKKRFGKAEGLRDWILLVELLLEWEAYLCETRMKKEDVKRLGKKHRYIMYIMKNVAKRYTGMGLKVSTVTKMRGRGYKNACLTFLFPSLCNSL